MDKEYLIKILRLIGNNPFIGVTVIHQHGTVIFRNKGMEELSGVNSDSTIGKHFSKVSSDLTLLEVLRTGEPRMGSVYSAVNGRKSVIHRIPLKDGDRVFGAMSIAAVYDIVELQDILKRYNLLKGEVKYLKRELRALRGSKYYFPNIVGRSEAILNLKRMARRFADKHSSVLITGESGTGKEIFAHAIHHASPRKDGPFIRINCSCFPPQLLESELFGYEGGAFTGAKREGKPGKFELAYKGTIFLDEIGDLPLEIQPKLLRVLEEREVWRLGGTTPRRTDFRIIASTNKNLEEMVKVDRFREDLYFRLNVLVLYIPPLRDRKEDISLLSRSLLAELNSELGTNFEISNGTLEALKSYDWPGNVRELRNVLERAIAIAEKGSIELENLPLHLLHTADHLAQAEGRNTEGLLGLTLGKTEYDLLTKILKTTGGNKTLSARLLGISRTSLYEKLNKYGIRN